MAQLGQPQRRDQRKFRKFDAPASNESLGLLPRKAGSEVRISGRITNSSRGLVIPNPMESTTSPPPTPLGTFRSFSPLIPSPRTSLCPMPRIVFPPEQVVSPHKPCRNRAAESSHPLPRDCYEVIGDPRLQVFRVKLPPSLLSGMMDDIINLAEGHARRLPGGWRTDLYSLTKCDMACRDIPAMSQHVKPVFEFMCYAIKVLYGCRMVVVDKNQPHILKYSAAAGHTGVELHHDRCDITANLALSKSTDYEGGGTLLADAGIVVRLEQGEFLLHPGNLVHGGMDITSGTRYLLVTFAHLT